MAKSKVKTTKKTTVFTGSVKEIPRKNTLSNEELEDLLKDWFDRDGTTYTHVGRDAKLLWTEMLDESAPYSEYVLASPTEKDLLIRSYPLAKDMLTAMNLPKKVRLRLSPADDSYTDGSTVVVSTTVLADTTLSTGARLDVFLGLAIHEGCHVKYTDFPVYGDAMKAGKFNKVVQYLSNLLEDERIEMALSVDAPGLVRFIERTKYYYFDIKYLKAEEELAELFEKKVKEAEEKEEEPPQEDLFSKLMSAILRIIRYPKYLKKEDFELFGAYLKDIKEILTPYPTTTAQALEAAQKIYEVIRDLLIAEEKEIELMEISAAGEGEGEREGETQTFEVTEKDIADAEEKMKLPKELEEALQVILIRASEDPKIVPEACREILKDPILPLELEGLVERHDATVLTKQDDDEYRYKDAYSYVQPYVSAVSRHLKGLMRTYRLTHRSMRSGELDTNKLAEAVQGAQNIYIRQGEVKTDELAVCVLGDESGSMEGAKIKNAQRAAILLQESIQHIPQIKLFVYGHTADVSKKGSTDILIYKEPGFKNRYALGSMRARYNNRDGNAILEVANRIRKHTDLPVLFFVLADGAPYAEDYSGSYAVQHTREQVQRVQKMGMRVVQVCIEHHYRPQEMFDHYIILDDLSTLAVDLGKVVKGAIDKMAVTRVL